MLNDFRGLTGRGTAGSWSRQADLDAGGKFFQGAIGLLVAVAFFLCPTVARAQIVYDNTDTFSGQIYYGASEFGDEIRLSDASRNVSQFVFEYYGDFVASGGQQAIVRFYRNDGPDAEPGASTVLAPSTLIYESDPVSLNAGFSSVSIPGLDLAVPATFTWTVQFVGVSNTAGNRAGLLLYSPPGTGFSYDDFWERSGGGWSIRNLGGNPVANFGARVLVPFVNNPPSISDISDQFTTAGTPLTVSFTVSDSESTADSLFVAAASTDQALVPDTNLVFGGAGSVRTLTITPVAGMTGTTTISVGVSDGPLNAIDTFLLQVEAASQNHPADNNPVNFTIAANEISAYGSSWRRGQAWPIGPNPIPANYISRGGSLWRGGERYSVNAGDSRGAPLWWVNVTVAPASVVSSGADPSRSSSPAEPAGRAALSRQSLGKQAITDSTAVSTLPANFTPGTAFTVSIQVNPDPEVTSYVVEDQVPSGWTVSGINNSGIFDGTNRKVKWGLFFDNSPRTLTYSITPPAGATGTAAFSGIASVDGENVPITGQRTTSATPPPLPVVTIIATDASASETPGDAATFAVSRTGATTAGLSVNLGIAGSALNGTDYSSIPGSITIPAGSATFSITITPTDDSAVEGTESVSLSVLSSPNYTVGSPGAASISIIDNDFAPTPPSIFSHPQSQTVNPGGTAIFSVGASGSGTLTYVWRFKGDVIPGESGSTLTRTGVTLAQAGEYRVDVGNSVGTVPSNPAILTVEVVVAPTITAQPQSQTVIAGSTATFSVGASGTAPFTYRWLYNNADVTGAVANGPTLSLNDVTAARAGNYSVVVGNSAGSATSGIAALVVNPKPADNQAPTISSIAPQIIGMNTTSPAIGFTVGDAETPATSLPVTAVSGNLTLLPASGIILSGSASNRTVTLTPALNQSGVATVTLTVKDEVQQTASTSFTLTVVSSTTPPSIGDIPDQGSSIGKSRVISFAVNDADAALPKLVLSATSSNPNLVPVSAIQFGGSGKKRTVTISPAAGVQGTTTIAITVKNDAGLSATDSFVFAVPFVNELPKVSTPARQITSAGVASREIAFTVSDKETPAEDLTVSGSSANTALVPAQNFVFGGSGTNRTVKITPAGIQSGDTTITLTVTDQDGGVANSTFDLHVTEVNFPPEISPLTDLTVEEDKSVSFDFFVADQGTPAEELVVTGTAANAALVPSANIVVSPGSFSRTARITPAPDRFGSTMITLQVEDVAGGTVTANFLLTVTPINDPPSISAIADQSTTEGTPTAAIAFTVADVDNEAANLSVTAVSSSRSLVSPAGLKLGGAGANRSLVITPEAGQTGVTTITVAVSDGLLSASRTFGLTVISVGGPPEIKTQPIARTVVEGGRAEFAVVAAGGGVLAYQWQHGDTNLPNATNATLVLTNVTLEQAGDYRVIVSNSAGSKTSDPAKLTVTPGLHPPVITTNPLSLTVLEGATAGFNVVATGAAPLRYQWSFKNAELPGATNASLMLTNVLLTQAGGYFVTITNVDGAATSQVAVLTVNAAPRPPSIITPPKDQTVLVGSNVTFTVEAAGDAPLSYQWRFKDTAIASATGAVLTLNTVTLDQAGNYTVAVSNSVGGVISRPALLTVRTATNEPPRVALVSPGNGVILAAGANVTVQAEASDSDGTVAKVEFFDGATKLGEALAAPFRVTWANVAAGKHTLTAKATDDRGATKTSDPVSISVKTGGPVNDNFAARILLEGVSVATNGSNANATSESGEPVHADIPGGRSVWWSWTAPAAGDVTLTTTGSALDTLLGVYTGETFDAFTVVAGNDDATPGSGSSEVSFTVEQGVTYHVAVDGFSGESGAIKLGLEFTEAKSPLVITPSSTPGEGITLSVPVALTGYIIEVTDDLGSGIWTPLNQEPVQEGDQNIIRIVITSGAKFFRLRPL